MYEALTGRRAFQKPTAAETMSAILNEDPPTASQFVPSIPPALQKVMHRCLEKNSAQRFQSASDLAFALEALSDSSAQPATALARSEQSLGKKRKWWFAIVTAALVMSAVLAILHLRFRSSLIPTTDWVQITNFPDSITQPSLSADGRMLTFVRGSSTFLAPGEIYIKIMPSGQPVQLTHDNLPKMSPVFSPDSSRIAYTALSGSSWDTWVVPVLGGRPERWLPNASGLVWVGPERLIFSEIKSGEHMAIVTTTEARGESRDLYVPTKERGMAHRSYPSPDGDAVLVAEMDNGEWLPCRVVPFRGEDSGRSVGPPHSPCTNAAWSPDGKWVYLSLHGKDNFHIWRQRFPNGQPEQITSGPTEEEGIALSPDGRFLITSVGLRQRTVSVHDANGDRRISLEGYAYWPSFSADGKKVYYRVLKGGTSPGLGASELWVADLEAEHSEPLLPGIAVTGYEISEDGRRVIFSAQDSGGKNHLWIAPTDRSAVPHQVPNSEGEMPFFLRPGEVVFHAIENGSTLAFRIREDGTEKQRLTSDETNEIHGVSPGGQFVIGWNFSNGHRETVAIPVSGGALPIPIMDALCFLRWQPDRKFLYLSVFTGMNSAGAFGRTYVIPLAPNKLFPSLPRDGFHSEAEIARLPGVRVIEAADVCPGSTSGTYAYSRQTVQRNLYRVPLP
jgi:Tol biopolymer transport system component